MQGPRQRKKLGSRAQIMDRLISSMRKRQSILRIALFFERGNTAKNQLYQGLKAGRDGRRKVNGLTRKPTSST